jgi:radical SAM protein with 4Fe4S-binding SPASM domain
VSKRLALLSRLGSLRQAIAAGAVLAPLIDDSVVPYPYVMILLLIRRCDSHCRMCNIWKDKTSPSLSLGQLEYILAGNDLSFVRSVTLSGGEPSLREDLPQVLELVLEHLPRVEHILLATNGLDTQHIIPQVRHMLAILDARDSRVRSFHVQVSLDGVGQVHDTVRGVPGAFHKVRTTLAQLRALQERFSRLKLRVHCVLMPENLPHVNSLQAFAAQESLDISYSLVDFSPEYYDNVRSADALSLSGAERATAQRFFAQLAQHDPSHFCYHYGDVAQMLQGKPRRRKCMMGHYVFILEHDGGVYPCLNCEGTCFGNLLRDSFEDIWFGRQADDARRQLRARCCPACSSICYSQPVNALEVIDMVWRRLPIGQVLGRLRGG